MVIPEKLEKMTEKEFRAEITAWIKTHYSIKLGKHVNLLDNENGLTLLKSRVKNMMEEKGMLKTQDLKVAA